MKTHKLLAFIGLGMVIFSCNKIKDLASISVDLPFSQSVPLPQTLIYDTSITHFFPSSGVSYTSPLLPVATNQQATLSNYNTATDKITSFTLKSITLIDSPASAHFDFLDTVQMYIATSANDSMLIAYKYGVTSGLDSLVLDPVPNANLIPYFKLNVFYFKFRGHFRTLPPNGLQNIRINAVMNLKANPLN